MPTPILMFKDHPELAEAEKQRDQSFLFMEKQIEEVKNKAENAHRTLWDSIYSYLERNNLANNPSKKRYRITDGVLYELNEEDQKSGFEKFMGMFK